MAGKYVRVTPQPNKATLADLQWEWRAAQQKVDALSETRAAGEKWATAITSLTGVFSLVVLIKGPEDISGVTGSVGGWLPNGVVDEVWYPLTLLAAVAFLILAVLAGRQRILLAIPFGSVFLLCVVLAFATVDRNDGVFAARDGHWVMVFVALAVALVAFGLWPSGGLRPIRPLAWTGAVLCIVLAAFALAQDLALWETVVVISLGCAVALASMSILAGARAAYGPVFPASAPSGGLLRDQQRREVRRSRTCLLLAIYPAVCAVAFIALAITVTWLATPDAPAPGNMLVLRRDAPPRCGELQWANQNQLEIQLAGSPDQMPIPWEEVRALTVVASCPQK